MSTFARRTVLRTAAAAGMGLLSPGIARAADDKPRRRFTLCLSCGPVGVPSDPHKAIAQATQYGFESVEPAPDFLGRLSDAELKDYLDRMKAANLVWGAAGLPVQFSGDDAAYDKSIKSLPATATALQRAGATRMATWLTPGHRTLTYVANFRLHAKRLRESARILGDHGVRLGLEYVGPKTSWSGQRFPFIHTMAEMKDLISEINRDNVGFLLDSWHWYTAHETEADLLSLRPADVVLCHINDAPKDIAIDQQVDSRRGLPCSTGVIDLKTFLGAMVKIGYDGPVVCEPFAQELRSMSPDQVLSAVAAAMKKSAALVD